MNIYIGIGIISILLWGARTIYTIVENVKEKRSAAIIDGMEEQVLRQGKDALYLRGYIDACAVEGGKFHTMVKCLDAARKATGDYIQKFPCAIEEAREELARSYVNGYEKSMRLLLEEEQQEHGLSQQLTRIAPAPAPTPFPHQKGGNKTIQFPTSHQQKSA